MRRALVLSLGIGFGLAVVALGIAGEVLSRAAKSTVGAPPPDLHAVSVTVPTATGGTVAGWLVRGMPGMGAVLLLHGVRADRRAMLGRARLLQGAGYSVLLVDLPAHGESTGTRIGFGLREAAGVHAAMAYLRQALPGERIGVIGVSLGAAALVFSRVAPAPDAVVLESMYPTIAEAAGNRLGMRLGAAGTVLAPLLLWQLPLGLGATAGQLRPIEDMSALHAPVLVASGTRDQHTTWAETQRIFQAANEPKELWAVDGAAHVDLHAFNPGAYASRVLRFLSAYLRHGTDPSTPAR